MQADGWNPESATTTNNVVVSEEGGSLRVGGVSLNVAPGSAPAGTVITARWVNNDACRPEVVFGPEGLRFDPPATLALQGPADCAGRGAVLTWSHVINGYAHRLPTTRARDRVTSQVHHFSSYAVIADRILPTRVFGRRVEHNGVTVTVEGPDAVLELSGEGDRAVLRRITTAPSPVTLTWEGLDPSRPMYWRVIGEAAQRGSLGPGGGTGVITVPAWEDAVILVSATQGTIVIAPGQLASLCGTAALPGAYSATARMCTLSADAAETVELDDPGQTLDCAGHEILGGTYGNQGVTIGPRATGASVQRCTIRYGIGIQVFSEQVRLEQNRILSALGPGSVGIQSNSARQLAVRDNQIIDAVFPVIVFGPQGGPVAEITSNTITNGHWGVFFGDSSFAATGSVPSWEVTQARIAGNTIASSAYGMELQIISAPPPGQLPVRVEGNTLTGLGMRVNWLGPGPGPRVLHNNVHGMLVSWDGSGFPVPFDASFGGEGNFWGRTALPLFVPGVDSNGTAVLDSHPYCVEDGWTRELLPGTCPPSIPAPPTPRLDLQDGAFLLHPLTELRGSSDAQGVEAWEGETLLGRVSSSNTRFVLPLIPAVGDGTHTLSVVAVNVDPAGIPARSPPVNIVVRIEERAVAAPVVLSPTNGAALSRTAFPAHGTGTAAALVDLHVDGALVGDAVVSDDGEWLLSLPALPAGTHSLHAIQRVADSASAPSASVTFSVAGDDPLQTTVSDTSGRASLRVLQVGTPVVHTALNEVSTTRLAVTARNLPPDSAPRIPVTVASVTYALTNNTPYVRTGAGAIQTGSTNQDVTSQFSLPFTGRDLAGRIPTVTTTLTRSAVAEVGWVERSRRNNGELIVPDDSRFAGMDLSSLGSIERGELRFVRLKTTPIISLGTVVVTPRIPITSIPNVEQCRVLFPHVSPGFLGPISRAVPDIRFCCPVNLPSSLTFQVTTREAATGGRQLQHFLTPDMCSGERGGLVRACSKTRRPFSPLGEACVSQVATFDADRNGVADVALCELRGLDLVPQSSAGARFPADLLLRPGDVKIDINLAPSRLRPTSFSALLGNNRTSGLDSDGDGVRDRFDTCPGVAEELARPAIDAFPSGALSICGYAGVPTQCVGRLPHDVDVDCIQDACDCRFDRAQPGSCPPAHACVASGSGICQPPPPRIPVANDDPLGDGLQSDAIKRGHIALLARGELAVSGHTRQKCRTRTGATPPAQWECWYPALLHWEAAQNGHRPTTWNRLDLSAAFQAPFGGPGYWEQEFQLGYLPAFAFEQPESESTDTPDADTLTSPDVLLTKEPHSGRSFLAFTMYDTQSTSTHHVDLLPRQDLERLHGAQAWMGATFLVTLDAGPTVSSIMNVESGARWPYTIRSSAVPTTWTVGQSLAVDADTGDVWVATLCGRDRRLCVWRVDPAGGRHVLLVHADSELAGWSATELTDEQGRQGMLLTALGFVDAQDADRVFPHLFRCNAGACSEVWQPSVEQSFAIVASPAYARADVFGDALYLTTSGSGRPPAGGADSARWGSGHVVLRLEEQPDGRFGGTLSWWRQKNSGFSAASDDDAALFAAAPRCLMDHCTRTAGRMLLVPTSSAPEPDSIVTYDGNLIVSSLNEPNQRVPLVADLNTGAFADGVLAGQYFALVSKDQADKAYNVTAVDIDGPAAQPESAPQLDGLMPIQRVSNTEDTERSAFSCVGLPYLFGAQASAREDWIEESPGSNVVLWALQAGRRLTVDFTPPDTLEISAIPTGRVTFAPEVLSLTLQSRAEGVSSRS